MEFMSLLSKDLTYISNEVYEKRDLEIREVKAMLVSLTKTVRNAPNS